MDREPELRAELAFGAIFGLGLSALGWALIFDPPAADPAGLGLLALAGASGAIRLPRAFRHVALVPVSIAAVALYGLGAAVAGAAIAGALAWSWDVMGGRSPGFRESAFEIGLLTTPVAIAGLAWQAVVDLGAPSRWTSVVPAAVVLAATFVLIRRVLLIAVGPEARRRRPSPEEPGLPTAISSTLLAAMTGLALTAAYRQDAMRLWLLAGPAIYFIYLLGRSRADRTEQRRRQQDQSERIYRSITRALTRATASDDPEFSRHLWRVQGLSIAVAEKLGATREDLDALSSAALLHDIGKVAVPEPVLSKPGKLTEREMESVKVHPAFGAEVLDALSFPPSIREMVRHHHERWDGHGYPDGLAGEEIPLGARILAVVDCYDAMISNRPYRRPLPASEACRHLRHESGSMFDPDVVDAALECIDDEHPTTQAPDSSVSTRDRVVETPDASSRCGLETIYAISRATRYPISFDECCTLVESQLADLVPHRSMVVYEARAGGERLAAKFVAGEARTRLDKVEFETSRRISGAAFDKRRALEAQDHRLTGDLESPLCDFEELLDDPVLRRLGSVLAAPMVADGEALGTLTLYDDDDRRFSAEDRRNLASVAGYLARAYLRERSNPSVRDDRMTDPLTGLPDTRFLWLEASQRFSNPNRRTGEKDGLIGLQVRGLSEVAAGWGIEMSDRAVCIIAKRLAIACRPPETLVRLGPDLFAVLCRFDEAGRLVERWNALVAAADNGRLGLPFESSTRVSIVGAEVRFPDDGETIESLVSLLDAKLSSIGRDERTVVAFRRTRTA